MTEVRITTKAVKLALIDKVEYLLKRAGCEVIRTGSKERVRLEITVPPDVSDPHGERLNAARTQTMR
jgi:hypothetical protein